MEKSKLKPFLRENLDILFIGLNPAKGSSDKGHYFSVNNAFWNQLYKSGLILKSVNKENADEMIFGNNEYNFNKLNYGITDLITEIAESDSTKIKPNIKDVKNIIEIIIKLKPKIVIILHGKVLLNICNFINISKPLSNQGYLGKILDNSESIFYTIAFPHGNNISELEKIKNYKKILINLTTL